MFAAKENGVEPVKSAVEIRKELNSEHTSKLKLDDVTTPDPYSISEGWVDEKDGIKFWAIVLYPDIFNYLMFFPSELKGELRFLD